MKLKTVLTATGITLLFVAAGMLDGGSGFIPIFIVIGVAVPMLIAADILHTNDQRKREEEEKWKIPDEYTN